MNYKIVRSDEYLSHHGILGQKWGKRNGPPYPLNESDKSSQEKKYAKSIKRAERKAINTEYKRYRKEGGHAIFSPFRTSTGVNYEKAIEEYKSKIANDSGYRKVSKAAFDTERARLLYEKQFYESRGYKNGQMMKDEDIDDLYSDKKYIDLCKKSENAGMAKDKYLTDFAKGYVNAIKDAKLKDMKITDNLDIAKKYVSDKFDDFYWDNNLEYNPDSFYPDVDVEKEVFK